MAFCSIKVEKILLAGLALARQSVVFSCNSTNGIIEWSKRQIVELVFPSVKTEISEIKLSCVVAMVRNVRCLEMSVSGAAYDFFVV
jgi:hypothetical protein